MGRCRYCGLPAGFLKYMHIECKDRHDKYLIKFKEAIDNCFNNNIDFIDFDNTFRELGQDGLISQKEVNELFQLSFDEFAEKIIERGSITDDEIEEVLRFKKITEWSEDKINCHGYLSKILYLHVKQSIKRGVIPSLYSVDKTACPFILDKTEEVLWIFHNVNFFKTQQHKSYSGGSSGVSVRITKGVYYRTSGLKGNVTSYYTSDFIECGDLYVTTQGIYFYGENNIKEIKFKKILSLEEDGDKITIQMKSSKSLPIKFTNIDPELINGVIQSFL